MRRFIVLTLMALLAGCGGSPSSAGKFAGEEKAVAQVVDDLQAAGRERDAQKICSRHLAKALVDRMKAGGTSCASELKASLDDADDFDLEVREVTVTGSTATARVNGREGRGDRVATMRFVKEGGAWKVAEIS